MITSNYLELNTTESNRRSNIQKTTRMSLLTHLGHEEDPDNKLSQMLLQNKYLVNIEQDEANLNESQDKMNQKKKKEIVSYTANRDTLYIPHPERSKRPVDIKSNLVEDDNKRQMADIGMQSDLIEYENKEKPFIPLKIGKDVGVQIEDGDLFNFDIEVEPLLTVLCGKILEETNLELTQECELKNIRETKASFLRKFRGQKEEIKKLEEEEIKKKKENDDRKKRRRLEKLSKIDTQQKLVSRIYSKHFLQPFFNKTLNFLSNSFIFKELSNVTIRDAINNFVMTDVELEYNQDTNLYKNLYEINNILKFNNLNTHKEKIIEHKLMIQNKKDEKERMRIEEQERIKKEEEDTKERRRIRKIKRIRESIKKQIFEVGVVKGEYHLEDISEIDNYDNEGPFVGVYGGLIGQFIMSLSLLKKNFFQGEQYYNNESILEILTLYLSESGNFNIYFNNIEEQLREVLDKPELEINNLKSNSNLTPEDWNKIAEILSDINLNYDHFLRDLLQEKLKGKIYLEFYSIIIKSICSMLEKGVLMDKINLIFKSPTENETLTNKIQKYQAFCKYTPNESSVNIIDNADFIKDSKKKKSIRAPEYEIEFKSAKLFNRTTDHNIIIYDKVAEFIIRNKILENCLRSFNTEMDTKTIFRNFNEKFDDLLTVSNIYEIIQFYEYNMMEINPNLSL